MKKEQLYFVSKCLFRIQKDITVNMPGDMPKENNPEDYLPYQTNLVAVYAKKELAKTLLNDKYLYNGSGFISDDDFGPNYFYNIHGHYHILEQKEVEVIKIDGKKYAKINNGFIEIIEESPSSNFEEGGFGK